MLRRRFPAIAAPRSEDICYATSNRQAAVKAIAGRCDAMLVIGAPNSSNSLRLVEVAEREGAPARLVERGADIDFDWLEDVRHARHHRRRVGARSAGPRSGRLRCGSASTSPRSRSNGVESAMVFKLPRELEAA